MDFIFLEDPTLNSKLITKDINKMVCRYCVDLLSKNTDIWLVFVEFQVAIKFVDKRSVKDLKEVSPNQQIKVWRIYHFSHSCVSITLQARLNHAKRE